MYVLKPFKLRKIITLQSFCEIVLNFTQIYSLIKEIMLTFYDYTIR